MTMRGALAAAALALVAACVPFVNLPGEAINEPLFAGEAFHTTDGRLLPVKSWQPEKGPAKVVIVALHGFNDYSNFFAKPGAYLARHGIASYAYDQRGFGGAPGRGLWPGVEAYSADLKVFSGLVRRRHPGTPLYLLGESMGAAVIMIATAGGGMAGISGVILAAPAVWGRATMPWYQRGALWIGVHIMPWVTLTGQGLKIKPSDNIEMLKALGRDPKVIKATRVDTIYGLVNLMDGALEKSARLDQRALILYGEKDEIIPKKPTTMMLGRLLQAASDQHRLALYQQGYHMLLRDLGAETPLADIVHWIADSAKPLPSGADVDARRRLDAQGTNKRTNEGTAGGC